LPLEGADHRRVIPAPPEPVRFREGPAAEGEKVAGRIPDDFFERLKPRLYERIGREIRLARCVLDVGCGDCDLARFLRKIFRQRVIGIDISDSSFPRRDKPGKGDSPLKCIKADASQLNFVRAGAVDTAVSMWALHEMSAPLSVLREVHRVLRPGGEILVVDFPRGSLAQRLWNERYYSPDRIARMLCQAGFQEVRARSIEQRQVIWAKGFKPFRRNRAK